jgi:3-dehydroquinate synthase
MTEMPLLVFLTGFSGTGKSAGAQAVAERLGWDWVDADAEIERAALRDIPSIFATDGEAAFRRLEGEAIGRILESAPSTGLVVALGGGATTTDDTRTAIAAAGLVICLEATPQTIVARLQARDSGSRPMLAGDLLASTTRLKDQRAPLYALADHTVHTDGLSVDEVAERVETFVREQGAKAFARDGRIEQLSRRPASLPAALDAPGAAAIVRTTSADYPAYVGWGELDNLGTHVARIAAGRRAFLVSDDNVLGLWGETALSSLRTAGLDVMALSVHPGDGSKSLESAGRIFDWLAAHRAERRDVLVALGGGVPGDLGGWVAASYMRGMPFVQAPTSLLGMVDASIGGKTAVNHADAKNLIGAFYQPRAVVADVAALKTLPRREYVEGFGEVIKHAFIRDPRLLELLEDRLEDVLALDPELTTGVIRRNIQIKAAVVSEDERESGGIREILNYGHTLGHALEAAGGYSALLHGEAVAVGMMAAATIGVRAGVTPPEILPRLERLLARAGLPLRPPAGIDREHVVSALSLDKKVIGGRQRWVLLEDVGRPVVRDDIPGDIVSEVVAEFLAQAAGQGRPGG